MPLIFSEQVLRRTLSRRLRTGPWCSYRSWQHSNTRLQWHAHLLTSPNCGELGCIYSIVFMGRSAMKFCPSSLILGRNGGSCRPAFHHKFANCLLHIGLFLNLLQGCAAIVHVSGDALFQSREQCRTQQLGLLVTAFQAERVEHRKELPCLGELGDVCL